jgi:hypothetical protein
MNKIFVHPEESTMQRADLNDHDTQSGPGKDALIGTMQNKINDFIPEKVTKGVQSIKFVELLFQPRRAYQRSKLRDHQLAEMP